MAPHLLVILSMILGIYAGAKQDYSFRVKTSNSEVCKVFGLTNFCGTSDPIFYRLCNTNINECGPFHHVPNGWPDTSTWYDAPYIVNDIGTPNKYEMVFHGDDDLYISRIEINGTEYDSTEHFGHYSLLTDDTQNGCDRLVITIFDNTGGCDWTTTNMENSCMYTTTDLFATPQPTMPPTIPTISPTRNPSLSPTSITYNPSQTPTSPTSNPTQFPTLNPSKIPTHFPSIYPTKFPTRNPSKS
eukprot:142624_1